MDSDRQVGSYSWHQSHDQATVLLFVPYETIADDLVVHIEQGYLVAGIRGQVPIIKGRLYGSVNTEKCMWQLERMPNQRGRTISTASTLSSQSSYAYVSDPEISSSFAASLESGQVSDNDDSDFASPERSHPVSRDEQVAITIPSFPQHAHSFSSHPASPRISTSMASSLSSIDSLQPGRTARLLTLYLEKGESIIWPALVVGPVPDSFSPAPPGPFVIDHNAEEKYNMDPTSLGLMGEDYLRIRNDKEEAFEFFVRSWHSLRTPLSTLRLVTHFLPVSSPNLQSDTPSSPRSRPPSRGTVDYYVHCIGGPAGLAQLYLDAGLAHLEGTASKLISSTYSPLSSIRTTDSQSTFHLESGTQTWKRDRNCAQKYFDRARQLAPHLEIPYLPSETDLRGHDRRPDPSRISREGQELQMPSMEVDQCGTLRPATCTTAIENEVKPDSTVRLRRRRQQASEAMFEQTNDDDEDNTWYLYLPGLIGAGTALLVVSVVGALSFQSWRKNQN